jgi:hypothetical protein
VRARGLEMETGRDEYGVSDLREVLVIGVQCGAMLLCWRVFT